MADVTQLILDELRGMRNEMNDGFKEYNHRVTKVETQIEPLFDNGTPGILTQLQDDVDEMQLKQARQFGWFAGAAAMLEVAWHLLSHKLGFNGHLSATH